MAAGHPRSRSVRQFELGLRLTLQDLPGAWLKLARSSMQVMSAAMDVDTRTAISGRIFRRLRG